jgi:uncharacterized protein with HEPN domain
MKSHDRDALPERLKHLDHNYTQQLFLWWINSNQIAKSYVVLSGCYPAVRPAKARCIITFMQIVNYMDGISHEEFLSNKLLQDGVIRQLEYPQVPWRQMIGLRNRMIHAYFNVNLQIIWEIVQGDLPDLKQETESILDSIRKECEGESKN